MDGFVIETLIHENVLFGTTGIGSIWGATFTPLGLKRMDPGIDDRLRSSAAAAAAQGSGYLLTFDLVIEENFILPFLNGVSLEGFTLSVGETRIVRNSVLGAMRVGIVCNGLTLPTMSRVDVASNLLQVYGYGIAAGTDDTRIVDNDVYGLIPARGTGSENPLAAFRIRPDGIALIPSVRPAGMARCQVRGNRLGRILGNAIGVHTEVNLTQISHNTIQGTAGDGITMTEAASAEYLVIEGNQIFAVSLLEDPGERGAGILLQNGTDIAAIGNTIARVGGGAPAGILGHNCLRLRILDNDIGEIGKPEDLGEAFGIVVSGVRVDIQDNAVRRVSDPSAKPSLDTTWWGIMVFGEEPKLAGAEPPPGAADIPGFVARTFAISNSLSEFVFDATRGRAVELPRGRPAIAVQGNRVEAVGGANAVYMQTTGSCVFSDNRCFLEARRQTVVKAFAGALVASDNYLEGPQDVPAADFTLSGGAGFTVSGNLGSGPIALNGAPAAATVEPAQRPLKECHMRIAHTRAGEPVDELAARVYKFEGEPSATALKAAGKALRDANPYLRRLSEVPEGTIVVVPELENAADRRSTNALEAATGGLVVERLREAATQAVELLAAELEDELADAESSLDVLRSSEARRVTRSDPEAKRARDETEDAIKERLAAAKRLGEYREQVASQIEQDLDELLEALRG